MHTHTYTWHYDTNKPNYMKKTYFIEVICLFISEYTNQPEYIVLVAACVILTTIIVIGLIGILMYIKRNKR